MNMNIYPKYIERAVKSHWIVKFLRFIAFFQLLGCAIAGTLYGGTFISTLLAQVGLEITGASAGISMVIGLILGIVVGLFASLGTWALALVVDDLHAIRIQTSGFIAVQDDHPHLGD